MRPDADVAGVWDPGQLGGSGIWTWRRSALFIEPAVPPVSGPDHDHLAVGAAGVTCSPSPSRPGGMADHRAPASAMADGDWHCGTGGGPAPWPG